MKALVNFQPLSFNTSGENFLIWKQISTGPEGLCSGEVAKPPYTLLQLSHSSIPRTLLVTAGTSAMEDRTLTHKDTNVRPA